VVIDKLNVSDTIARFALARYRARFKEQIDALDDLEPTQTPVGPKRRGVQPRRTSFESYSVMEIAAGKHFALHRAQCQLNSVVRCGHGSEVEVFG
jgi:hypothetical protein